MAYSLFDLKRHVIFVRPTYVSLSMENNATLLRKYEKLTA